MRKNWFTRFLVSKVSGWIAVVALSFIVAIAAAAGKFLIHYSNLKEAAAYCEGQRAAVTNSKSLVGRVEKKLNEEKDTAIQGIKEDTDASTCLDQRAPDSVLEYHKRMRDN